MNADLFSVQTGNRQRFFLFVYEVNCQEDCGEFVHDKTVEEEKTAGNILGPD